ncbi:MAG: TraB/GumN family protein, partial [Calditrichia bacterium]
MQQSRWFLLFLMVMVSLLFSETTTGEKNRTSLWKIETGHNTVYLLGSIHLLKEQDFPLPGAMEAAFSKADVLVFETNLDSTQTPAFQQYVLSKAMLPQGQTLSGVLDDSLYNAFKREAEPLGLPVDRMQVFRPWFAGLNLAVMKMQQLGFDPETGIDRYFFQKAKSSEKEIIGLETAAFQINLLGNLGGNIILQQTLEQINDTEKYLDEILGYWRSGNLAGLEETLVKSFKDHPEIYRQLIVERNRRWLQEIETYLGERQNYLIVVGVGHMAGEQGLIRMLQNAGHTVNQL